MNNYSLKDLLEKEIVIDIDTKKSVVFDKIEIPMIQRDYAQGRQSESDVRKRFLDAIFNSILHQKKMEMDFVYGSIYEAKTEEGEIIHLFIPLDGQQRLTTLFLLYWYIGLRELSSDDLTGLMQSLKKFTYATRTSSRRFCDAITSHYPQIKPQLIGKSPQKVFSNLSWFYESYQNDPTISAMLNMLNDIHERYATIGRNDLFASLDNLKFYVLPLDGFNLTEELYVKMNARGKPLTDFENFKADFIKWMKSDQNKEQESFHAPVTLDKRKMAYYMAISQKLDNNWADLLWQEIKNKPEEALKPFGYVIDPYIMRFFHRYLCNLTIQNEGFSDNSTENSPLFRYFYGNNGNDQHIPFRSFEIYEPLLDFDTIRRIEHALDTLRENMETIRRHINPSWEEKAWNIFDPQINQRQRIAFYATTLYMEHTPQFQQKSYQRWMRFVWNLIIDPAIRNIPTMIRAMKQIKEYAIYSDDIISALANSNQCQEIANKIEEEAVKARLIKSNPEIWEELIIDVESHPLFKGEVRFLFPEADRIQNEDFFARSHAAVRIFADNDLNDHKRDNYLWLRATLAQNESFPDEINLSNDYDNWRHLINEPLITGFRKVIECFINNPELSARDILTRICNDYSYDVNYPWVHPIVTWVGTNGEILLEYSETKKIQYYDYYGNWPRHTYLYNKSRWTSGNIMLSSFRNQICEAFINRFGLIRDWPWGNIGNSFFRGDTVTLTKTFNGYPVSFFFDTRFLRVGILQTDVNDGFTIDLSQIDDQYKADGWLCRVKYDYLEEVKSLSDIELFADKIDKILKGEKFGLLFAV